MDWFWVSVYLYVCCVMLSPSAVKNWERISGETAPTAFITFVAIVSPVIPIIGIIGKIFEKKNDRST